MSLNITNLKDKAEFLVALNSMDYVGPSISGIAKDFKELIKPFAAISELSEQDGNLRLIINTYYALAVRGIREQSPADNIGEVYKMTLLTITEELTEAILTKLVDYGEVSDKSVASIVAATGFITGALQLGILDENLHAEVSEFIQVYAGLLEVESHLFTGTHLTMVKEMEMAAYYLPSKVDSSPVFRSLLMDKVRYLVSDASDRSEILPKVPALLSPRLVIENPTEVFLKLCSMVGQDLTNDQEEEPTPNEEPTPSNEEPNLSEEETTSEEDEEEPTPSEVVEEAEEPTPSEEPQEEPAPNEEEEEEEEEPNLNEEEEEGSYADELYDGVDMEPQGNQAEEPQDNQAEEPQDNQAEEPQDNQSEEPQEEEEEEEEEPQDNQAEEPQEEEEEEEEETLTITEERNAHGGVDVVAEYVEKEKEEEKTYTPKRRR